MLGDYKIIILRNNKEICSFAPKKEDINKNIILNLNCSISEFPTAYFKSNLEELNQVLMPFSRDDILCVSGRRNNSDDYKPYFKGMLFIKNFKYNKEPKKTELEIKAVHSFFKLTLLQFKDIKIYNNIDFGFILDELVNIAGINLEDVIVDNEIRKLKVNISSYKSNIFRIFKDMCLNLGLTVDFERDNTVKIEYTKEKIKNFFRKDPVFTLTQDDIISMSTSEGVI